MIYPKRIKRPRMGVRESGRIECPGHLRFVRGFECSCKSHARFPCEGRIEAHHQVTRGAGGGDEQAVPLCAFHHSLLDSPGWSQKRLAAECSVDFERVAAHLWKISPHRLAWERKRSAA